MCIAADPKLLDDAAQELSETRAAVLVGAGASADANLPNWTALLETFARDLPTKFGDAVAAFASEGRYLEAADLAKRAAPDGSWWHARLEPFARTGMVTSAWRLVASMGIAKMVTTNWDNVGQDSYADVWNRTPATHVGLDELLTPLDDPYPHIIHVHGKAPRWASIVFAASEYEIAEQDPRYRDLWLDLLLRRPLLIVGVSAADPAFGRLIQFVREKLRIGHKIKPTVVCPASVAPDRFGGHARILSYDDSMDHRGALSILRDLRDRINKVRSDAGQQLNPFARAGLPAHFNAPSEDLAYALAGSDLRQHCSAEMLTTLALLLNDLSKSGSTALDRVSALASSHMRLSAVEAEEISEHAISYAKSCGWVSSTPTGLVATDATPRPDTALFGKIVDEVVRQAQKPLVWTQTQRHYTYVKSALLEYLGGEGGRTARTLLGFERGEEIDARRLQSALLDSRTSIGDASIERQICASVISVTANPPEALSEPCGRLGNFAVVQNLVSLSAGRDLLRSLAPVEAVYFDTNIILPAMALGHRWSRRCASLIARCRRTVSRILVLDGFAEELVVQLDEAGKLAGSVDTPEKLYGLSWTYGQSNGFLEAYREWCDEKGLRSFDEYVQAIGVGDPIVRLNGLGCTIVPAPREWGREAEIHARVIAYFSGSNRPEKLVQHEADQVAQLVRENRPGSSSVRFVTAHERLRSFLVREHFPIAAAVTPPVALAHLLAATAPSDVPPETLRDLAFDAGAVQVAEVIYGILLTRWRKDRGGLKRLASAEVTDEIMTQLRRLNDQFGAHGSIDSRCALLEVVEKEILPQVELRAARLPESAPTVLDPPQSTEHPSEAARRLATELTALASATSS